MSRTHALKWHMDTFVVHEVDAERGIAKGDLVRYPTGRNFYRVQGLGVKGYQLHDVLNDKKKRISWESGKGLTRVLLKDTPVDILNDREYVRKLPPSVAFTLTLSNKTPGKTYGETYTPEGDDRLCVVRRNGLFHIGLKATSGIPAIGDLCRSKRRKPPGKAMFALQINDRGYYITTPNGLIDVNGKSYPVNMRNIEHVPLDQIPRWMADDMRGLGYKMSGRSLANRTQKELDGGIPYLRVEGVIKPNKHQEENGKLDVADEDSPAISLTTEEDKEELRMQRMSKIDLRKAAMKRGMTRSASASCSKEELVDYLKKANFKPPRMMSYRSRKSAGRTQMEKMLRDSLWPSKGIGVLTDAELKEAVDSKKGLNDNHPGVLGSMIKALKADRAARFKEQKGLTVKEEALREEKERLEGALRLMSRDKEAFRLQLNTSNRDCSRLRSDADSLRLRNDKLLKQMKNLIPNNKENREALEIGKEAIKKRKELKATDDGIGRFLAVDAFGGS